MCKYESAVKFLDEMRFIKKDDAYVRCTYLNTPESVYAADIFFHSTCFMQYVHLSKQSETKYGPPQTKPNVSWKLCLISIEQRWLWVDSY